jgi:Protein of unknown function (DUF1360)
MSAIAECPDNAQAKRPALAEERPHMWYAGLISVFAIGVGTVVGIAGRKLPKRTCWGDVALVALASHDVSRLVARDEVTTVIRAPVTEDPEGTEPKGRGPARALGELLTCPYCIGLWVTAGLSSAMVMRPREARFVASIFAADAGANLLHGTFSRLR